MTELEKFRQKSSREAPVTKKYLRSLKTKRPGNLDALFAGEHEKVFSKTDCLQCANCCKTTSPIILQADMDRMAKALRISTSSFLKEYLQMDEDGDFVFKQTPCPFLDNENYCRIYEARPKACREYPHTNRKRMHEILDLTYRNSLVCPAVFEIVNNLQTRD